MRKGLGIDALRTVPRVLWIAALTVAVLVAGAPVAAADPAKPTDYRSRVLAITPAAPPLSVKVVGGDGFLDLHVDRGHTAAVEGYEGEPWLKVEADGTVRENQLSTATYLNSNRYGNAVIPPGASAQAARERPQWKTVGHDGRYIWHDHRIHYMTPQIAPHLLPGTNRVLLGDRADGKWVVPMSVDGKPVKVVGELVKLEAPNPLGWWALAAVLVVAGAVLAGLGRRRFAMPVALVLVGTGGIAGLVAGVSELSVVPAAAGGSPVAVVLPAVAVLAVVVASVVRNRATKAIAVLAGAAALLAWAVLRVGALDHAVPLSGLPAAVARLLVALALGTALGGAIAGIRSGALALAPLDGPDEDVGPFPESGREPAG